MLWLSMLQKLLLLVLLPVSSEQEPAAEVHG